MLSPLGKLFWTGLSKVMAGYIVVVASLCRGAAAARRQSAVATVNRKLFWRVKMLMSKNGTTEKTAEFPRHPAGPEFQ